jgi:hypothetical protein
MRDAATDNNPANIKFPDEIKFRMLVNCGFSLFILLHLSLLLEYIVDIIIFTINY